MMNEITLTLKPRPTVPAQRPRASMASPGPLQRVVRRRVAQRSWQRRAPRTWVNYRDEREDQAKTTRQGRTQRPKPSLLPGPCPVAQAEAQASVEARGVAHHPNLTCCGSTATPDSWHIGLSQARQFVAKRGRTRLWRRTSVPPRVLPLSRPRVIPLVVPGHEILTESMLVRAENRSAE